VYLTGVHLMRISHNIVSPPEISPVLAYKGVARAGRPPSLLA
jgi:hypothetical protein